MRSIVISSVIIAIALTICGILYFPYRYKSAFEADQQCHYEKSITYSEKSTIECDHDLETRQWILFENSLANNPARVISRFRY